jgi:hypothetical protein
MYVMCLRFTISVYVCVLRGPCAASDIHSLFIPYILFGKYATDVEQVKIHKYISNTELSCFTYKITLQSLYIKWHPSIVKFDGLLKLKIINIQIIID